MALAKREQDVEQFCFLLRKSQYQEEIATQLKENTLKNCEIFGTCSLRLLKI